MQAPIADSSGGYIWYNSVAKGSGVTDSLGNDITGVQTGANSIDAALTTIYALIDTEKAALSTGN
jgi:hypothetical protein